MLTPRATIDFESRSECDLKECGSWRYSLDPTTEILCLAFHLPAWEPDRTGLWHPAFPHLGIEEPTDDQTTSDLYDLWTWINDDALIEAHNAWFERGIWTNILAPRYGWPMINHRQWRCSAAKAATHALPRGLGDAADALMLAVKKDDEGHTLMKKLSKPRKAVKADILAWNVQHNAGPCPQCKGKGTYKRKPCERCEAVGHLPVPLADVPPMPTLWHESREEFERLWAYCRQDVLAERGVSLALPDLSPAETEMYLLDQAINERGFQLDEDAVAAALELIELEAVDLNGVLTLVTDGQVTRGTQRARLVAWLEANGLVLFDTQAQTISDVLATRTDLSPLVREALTLLQELGRSSTGKYERMRAWKCPDGRVRGGLLFHGAATGRWSGAGVQPHNFVRGTVKISQDRLWDALKTQDREFIRNLTDDTDTPIGSVMVALANALRGAICAAPGRQLYVADYAAIEARVLLWLADDPHIDIFYRDEDIYLDMASTIYGRVCTKKEHPQERQLGKATILGCFGADTDVLTDRGWVPIAKVLLTDRLWDGEEWVTHDGVVFQGMKPTISLCGLTVTPDHLIQTHEGWLPSAALADDSPSLLSARAWAHLRLPVTREVPAAGWSESSSTARAQWSRPIYARAEPNDVTCVGSDKPGARKVVNDGATAACAVTRFTESGWPIELPRPTDDATTLSPASTRTMGAGGSTSHGRTLVRAAASLWRTCCHYLGGMTRRWRSTESTTMVPTVPAICVSQHAARNYAIVATFDIANAGPRHRFFVRAPGRQDVLCAHNCGYGMGWEKFIATAATYGVVLDEKFSKHTVYTYRDKYYQVVDLWYAQEEAAIEAVLAHGKVITCGRIKWYVERGKHRFLYAELPSGRRLAYAFPQVMGSMTNRGWKNQLTFMSVSSYNHQWQRQRTYGGSVVENLVQAIARDLMADSMLKCEASGVYHPVLSVHDELIAEADEGTGNLADYERLLTTPPAWASDCPIAAEGWVGTRYRK